MLLQGIKLGRHPQGELLWPFGPGRLTVIFFVDGELLQPEFIVTTDAVVEAVYTLLAPVVALSQR
jgi:hypothetical protein